MPSPPAQAPRPLGPPQNELLRWSASEMAARVRAKDVSSAELVRAHIERIEEVDPALNAVVVRRFEEALREAEAADEERGDDRGPLHGVPVTIKEQYLVRETPTTWGLRHRAGHRADREGTLVTRLREAGAILLAKTNVPQLLIAHETDNALYGRSRNPWNLERSPGGSSGGEAALIAAFGSPLGLGGDLGGSIRVPAHCAGIHGLKPTAGRLPGDDNPFDIAPPPEAIVAQGGPLARHVGDLSLAMRIFVGDAPLSGPTTPPVPWSDPQRPPVEGLRVAVQEDDGHFSPSPALRRAVREAATALEARGAELVGWDFPVGEEASRHFLGLLGADGFASFARALAGEPAHPLIAGLLRGGRMPRPLRAVVGRALRSLGQRRLSRIVGMGGKVDTEVFLQRLAKRFTFRERFASELRRRRIDVLLSPPYGLPALVHGASEKLIDAASYAFVHNVLGLPAGVVAATRVGAGEESDRAESCDQVERAARAVEEGSVGLPVGVQVAAPWWREDTVLSVMAALEEDFRSRSDYPELGAPAARSSGE